MTGMGAGFGPTYTNPFQGDTFTDQQKNSLMFKTASSMASNGSDSNWTNIQNLAKTDPAYLEKLVNYFMTEESNKTAREWTAQREDSTYQRLMKDLKKAGISPYVLTGATPAVSSSSGKSYTSTEAVTRENSIRSSDTNLAKQTLASFGVIIGALIGALALI